MDTFTHKTLTTSPFDLTYSYYLSPNFHENLKPELPTLLLLHGYPDDAHMWAGAVPLLLKLPYPMIIPDLLGFAGSSKPTDASKYNYRHQADSLQQILDHEKVPNNVIPIGHDWGSAVSQRFYLYNKSRCIGLILLSLAYQIPSREPFDLDKANRDTAQRFGYPQWEYWNFFTAPDAPALMKAHLDRFYEVNHGNFPSRFAGEDGRDIWMREMFCTPGAMREYITGTGRWENRTVDLKPYAENQELRRRFIERLTRDGLEGPVNYYHSLKNNTMLEDERELCEKSPDGGDRRNIDVPVMYIGQRGDWVCRTDLMEESVKREFVMDMEDRVIDAGHWVLYEQPETVAKLIAEWLIRRYGGIDFPDPGYAMSV